MTTSTQPAAGRTLTEEQRALLPSDADVEAYRKHGWYVSPTILDDDVIDMAVEGARRHWAGERDVELPISEGYMDWRPGDSETVRIGEIIALRNKAVRALVEQPLVAATAARLAGTSEIRLWESELIQKPPQQVQDGVGIGWHTDRAYWMTCTSDAMLTAWIPLHDCPSSMGPLTVIEGSHHWSLDHDELRRFRVSDLDRLENELVRGRGSVRKKEMTLSKGQVSFHNSLVLHGSEVNRSDGPRLCVALHLQDRDNRYRRYRNADGELWKVVADRLCRSDHNGDPDYTDPDVCPVLWHD